MAIKIRLTRLGDKKSPFYRVVVADARVARDGQYIEQIGTYNPLKNPAEIKINNELAQKIKKAYSPNEARRIAHENKTKNTKSISKNKKYAKKHAKNARFSKKSKIKNE